MSFPSLRFHGLRTLLRIVPVVLLAWAAAPAGVVAAPSEAVALMRDDPALAVDATVKSLVVQPGMERAVFTFQVKNVSASEVVIVQVRTSCDCTTAQLPGSPWKLAPGAGGEIALTVELRGLAGPVFRTASVDTLTGTKLLTMNLALPASAAVASGATPDAGPTPPEPAQPGTAAAARDLAYARGRLIVKYRDAADQLTETTEMRTAAAATGASRPVSTVEALKVKHGVRKQTPLFRTEDDERRILRTKGRLDLATIKQHHAETMEAVRARFPVRARRASAADIARGADASLQNIYVIETDPNTDLARAMAEFSADPNVEWVEPDRVVTVAMIPNDPYYKSGSLRFLDKIKAPQAWDIAQGEGVIVAVIDTGVDYNHEDLAANMWTNTKEIPNNGKDDDGNGYVDDVRGINRSVLPGDPKANDPLDSLAGHGTGVAGVIAAVANNNLGVAGVAPKAKIMPVKIAGDTGKSFDSTNAEGILYAAKNGADVINNSWACAGECTNPISENAIRQAKSLGAVVVFGAGNLNTDVAKISPQNMPEVITVASVDSQDGKASSSNYGNKIDVAAQGVGLIVVAPFFGYGNNSGTSFAAPQVSGLAALLLSKYPNMTTEEVKTAIIQSADDVESVGNDIFTGAGRINALAALQNGITPIVRIDSPALNQSFNEQSAMTPVMATIRGVAVTSYELSSKRDIESVTTWTTVAAATYSGFISNQEIGKLNVGSLPTGNYLLRLRVVYRGPASAAQVIDEVRAFSISMAPTVVAQSASRTVVAGAATTFSVTASGTPPLSYQWRKDGTVLAGATGATLTLNSVQPSDAGTYTVTVSNGGGTVSATPTVLTVSVPPTVLAQIASRTVVAGAATTFSVSASGTAPLSYQWRKDGTVLAGVTGATLTLNSAQPGDAGTYAVTVSNSAGTVSVTPAVLTVSYSRLLNLSILTTITPASPLFTIGTVIGGAGTGGGKPLLVRAAGPALTQLGVVGALPDPKLDLFSGQTVVATNDNWAGTTTLSAAFTQVGAFAYASAASKDAAVYNSNLQTGAYTVQVSGVDGSTGAVIAELYDATPAAAVTTATPRLINVSVLKQVGAGEILTGGFVIGGNTAKPVLLRAVGPTLGAPPFNVGGAMADPKLDLFRGQTVINANDNWGGGTVLATTFVNVGAFALSAASRDAALLVTLQPGDYTVQVTGVNGSAGLALVEVYEVP